MTTTYTANNVKEKTTTEGFLNLSLDGAADGSQTFYAGVGNGANVIYTICDEQNFILEIGVGTLTHGTPDVLFRDIAPIYSTAGTAPTFTQVNLPAGIKTVHIGAVAGHHDGDLDFHGNSITNATEVLTRVTVAESAPIDLALGHSHYVLITGTTIFSVLNHPDTDRVAIMKLVLENDSTAGHSITLPAGFTPINSGIAPILNTAPYSVNVVMAITYDAGITWRYWLPMNGEGDQAATILTQDGGGDISIDLKPKRNGYYFDLNVNGHLNAPINQVAGQEFNIVVFQATSGACTLTAAADFKFGTAGLSVDTTLNSTTVIKCIVAYDGYIMSRVYKEV